MIEGSRANERTERGESFLAEKMAQDLGRKGDIPLLQPRAKTLFVYSRLTDAHLALCITTFGGGSR